MYFNYYIWCSPWQFDRLIVTKYNICYKPDSVIMFLNNLISRFDKHAGQEDLCHLLATSWHSYFANHNHFSYFGTWSPQSSKKIHCCQNYDPLGRGIFWPRGIILTSLTSGASVVWHHSLPLMNSFNKTEAAVFSYRLCFLRAFSFISLM